MMKNNLKVLFFVVYPDLNAGTRYRVYKYLPYLKAEQIEFTICPPLSNKLFKYFFQTKNPVKKLLYYLFSYLNRIPQLFKCWSHDIIFIHQGLSYLGPPVLEKLIYRFNKNIIFDTDDAHFARPDFATGLAARLYDRNRIAKISKISKHVIVSVDFIKNYISRINSNVTIIPTSIDLSNYELKHYRSDKSSVIIGWAGTASGLIYLNQVEDVIRELSVIYDIKLKVISSDFPDFKGVDVVKCPWSLKNEIADLQSLDIGIMPLLKTDFEKGKGGFKLIQYMGVGLPVVCTPIGLNKDIVKNGVNGFLADSSEEWLEKLSLLIEDDSLREKMGRQARKSIENLYTIERNAPRFINVLKSVV